MSFAVWLLGNCRVDLFYAVWVVCGFWDFVLGFWFVFGCVLFYDFVLLLLVGCFVFMIGVGFDSLFVSCRLVWDFGFYLVWCLLTPRFGV